MPYKKSSEFVNINFSGLSRFTHGLQHVPQRHLDDKFTLYKLRLLADLKRLIQLYLHKHTIQKLLNTLATSAFAPTQKYRSHLREFFHSEALEIEEARQKPESF